MSTTYLEFSDADSGEHKFYEVTVNATTVTIRFGRIGTTGQTQTLEHASSAEAEKTAQKKLAEKRKKGYAEAVPGQTAKQDTRHATVLKEARALLRVLAFGNETLAESCWRAFKEEIENADTKEEFDGDNETLLEYAFQGAGDWQVLYFVDWKDTESMIGQLERIARNVGLTIVYTWPTDDPENDLDNEAILALAAHQLAPLGVQLWDWPSGGDDYRGWMVRAADAPAMQTHAHALGFEVQLIEAAE